MRDSNQASSMVGRSAYTDYHQPLRLSSVQPSLNLRWRVLTFCWRELLALISCVWACHMLRRTRRARGRVGRIESWNWVVSLDCLLSVVVFICRKRSCKSSANPQESSLSCFILLFLLVLCCSRGCSEETFVVVEPVRALDGVQSAQLSLQQPLAFEHLCLPRHRICGVVQSRVTNEMPKIKA